MVVPVSIFNGHPFHRGSWNSKHPTLTTFAENELVEQSGLGRLVNGSPNLPEVVDGG